MTLDVKLSLVPMESESVDALPGGAGWQYEPKFDGFRCLAFRDGDRVDLQSRNQKPLARFFPEVQADFAALPVERFVLDGELIIRPGTFETLQLRLHPAASRIDKLSREYPATFAAFDLLADARGRSLLAKPFVERRAALEAFFAKIGKHPRLILSRATRSRAQANKWLKGVGHGLDGIIAKRLDLPYQPGERCMLKFKLWKTIDCVIAGLYTKTGTQQIESLLLGLYDEAGLLHYVGHAGTGPDEPGVRARLAPLMGRGGFTGRAAGGKSRWSTRQRSMIPVEPQLVVEVTGDHITDQRFRHGARVLRWREDKRPAACTMDQIAPIAVAR